MARKQRVNDAQLQIEPGRIRLVRCSDLLGGWPMSSKSPDRNNDRHQIDGRKQQSHGQPIMIELPKQSDDTEQCSDSAKRDECNKKHATKLPSSRVETAANNQERWPNKKTASKPRGRNHELPEIHMCDAA
jgi:hypothetical protein